MTSADKIKDAFSHPTIGPFIGQPRYETIKPMHHKLNTNTASIVSHLGNSCFSLLFLTVASAVFNTPSATMFIPPVNPVPLPHYPPGATQFQIQAINATHDTNTRLFKQYDATNLALKQ